MKLGPDAIKRMAAFRPMWTFMNPRFYFLKACAVIGCALVPHMAEATDICWINAVVFTPASATITFAQDVRGVVMKGSESSSELRDVAFWVHIQSGMVQRQSRNDDGSFTTERPTFGGFDLSDGQLLRVSGGPHDNCTLLVTRQAGKRGLLLRANSFPSGMPQSVVQKFIEAN
jgi:hypothetical protein